MNDQEAVRNRKSGKTLGASEKEIQHGVLRAWCVSGLDSREDPGGRHLDAEEESLAGLFAGRGDPVN